MDNSELNTQRCLCLTVTYLESHTHMSCIYIYIYCKNIKSYYYIYIHNDWWGPVTISQHTQEMDNKSVFEVTERDTTSCGAIQMTSNSSNDTCLAFSEHKGSNLHRHLNSLGFFPTMTSQSEVFSSWASNRKATSGDQDPRNLLANDVADQVGQVENRKCLI